jgi:hypothetical protein
MVKRYSLTSYTGMLMRGLQKRYKVIEDIILKLDCGLKFVKVTGLVRFPILLLSRFASGLE